MHSFEYEDAQEAFQAALEKDSTEVMAHWGEAMTHYKALWGLQNEEAGRAVINRLGEDQDTRLASIEDELERDFWQALETLYGEGSLDERNKAYADFMGTLYEKYPGNQEVAAFYSLGLMWSVDGGRDAEVFDLSSHIAEGILIGTGNSPDLVPTWRKVITAAAIREGESAGQEEVQVEGKYTVATSGIRERILIRAGSRISEAGL